MTLKNSRSKFLAFLISATVILSMIPASAFGAVSVGGSTGSTVKSPYGNLTFYGWSRTEYHTDFYANGYSYTKCASKVQPGWLANRTEVSLKFGSTWYLIATGASSNKTTYAAQQVLTNHVWGANRSGAISFKTQSYHTVKKEKTGSKSFGSSSYLDWIPGWPLP